MRQLILAALLLAVGLSWIAVSGSPRASSNPLGDVANISSGETHACAVTTAGGVKCWGSNNQGQLGDGSARDSPTPTDVTGLATGVQAVSAGTWHTCALTSSGQVECWGANDSGQLGDGQACGAVCTTPVEVLGLTNVDAITVGFGHSCAVIDGGGVKCWGENFQGQLGDGQVCGTTCNTPVDVSGLTSGTIAVDAGTLHTCAVTDVGSTKCWGGNWAGQLGDGTTVDRQAPVNVSGLATGAATVSSGYGHTCVLTTVGSGKCWGNNFHGQLGDGSTTDRSIPVNVSGMGDDIRTIAADGGHTCALTDAASVRCWGSNGRQRY